MRREGPSIGQVLLLAVPAALAAGAVVATLVQRALQGTKGRRRKDERTGYAALIGNTPLIELRSLSDATGCRIMVKAEFLNPGGTSKDRVALQMIEEAEAQGRLKPGGTVVEGTSGSTGIALASLCRARGYRCLIVMPDDQAVEKVELLRRFGAQVEVVKTAAIANPNHYCRVAHRRAQEIPGGVYMEQFENQANFNAHFHTTGPEILEQLQHLGLSLDAFVMAAGTGGTIAGVSQAVKQHSQQTTHDSGKKMDSKTNMDSGGQKMDSKEKMDSISRGPQGPHTTHPRVVLVDPPGSSLYHKVKHGVCFTPQQRERGVRRHRYDTIAEGIGLDRLTANFQQAWIDDAVRVSDQEGVHMAHYLLHHEGLFVGSSSAMNVVGALVTARRLGPGHTIVTLLCDGGYRHMTRFWNRDFVSNYGLSWPEAPPQDLSFVPLDHE